MSQNSFGAKSILEVGDRSYQIHRLSALADRFDIARLPYALKVLLEGLLRNEGLGTVEPADVEALAGWSESDLPSREITFAPARVLMQDFTGVPAIVDLAAMREAIVAMGGEAARINPLVPVELVIDHSVQVDRFGTADAFAFNADLELERNRERYAFLRWAQDAFGNFAVVPPDTGICHQVNLEYLSRVVFAADGEDGALAYPDTLVGTDSHTTMVNGLGVLGWGVGGIEAEAAMLGQPIPMLIPQVLGLKLHGKLRAGATATDLVLTVTEHLRERGVVGKFVEVYGEGLAGLPLADRATIGNMSPEFGCTCAIFPVDGETIRYLRLTGRPEEQVALVEAYCREQGLWHEPSAPEPRFSEVMELDLGSVVPSIAGPKRPQDRISLSEARSAFRHSLDDLLGAATTKQPAAVASGAESNGAESNGAEMARPVAAPRSAEEDHALAHGDVVIAAITSCTNTSNPSVLIAAGLLARNAVARGLKRRPWVKSSLAPGSRVVTDYLRRAELLEPLEQLGFNLVGYGCTTCIGNSGPLDPAVSDAIAAADLAAVAVLSGNRNFEGRINPDVKMNYLASPPLCVAYALAGTMDIDIASVPLGEGADGAPVFLREIWPDGQEVAETVERAVRSEMFKADYADVFEGDARWQSLAGAGTAAQAGGGGDAARSSVFDWEPESTYVRRPPYFDGMPATPPPVADIEGARVLALLGDSVTTDHISPAGSIRKDGPAGEYLQEHGVAASDFNSYGARRGNHEVMMRGTFANIRLRNLIGGGERLPEGGFTRHFSAAGGANAMTIYEAALLYQREDVPLVVLAGKEYGTGSSRDWAAKGTNLLGVRAVIAESFERIHRSNLIGMGVLPLQFPDGVSAAALGVSGEEFVAIAGIASEMAGGGAPPQSVRVQMREPASGSVVAEFDARVRLDTPREAEYFRNGGILQYVLRELRAG